MGQRMAQLSPERFGYRVIHFEHDKGHEVEALQDNYLGNLCTG